MVIDCLEEGSRMPTATGSTGVPNVLVVEDEMVLRMRAVDIVEDAGFILNLSNCDSLTIPKSVSL
jgi:hypothetical protein